MSIHVLLVDDCVDQVHALAELLSDDVLAVSVATSGATALERIRQSPPDAIVADLGLQDMTGLDVVRRARIVRPDVRAIILTGYPRTHPLVMAAAAEHIPYREKPVDVRELVALLAHPTGSA